MHLVTLIGV